MFWCEGKKNSIKKIIKIKEDIFDEVLSVENLSKMYFEFNFMKLLMLDYKEINKINELYSDILDDRMILKCLRKVIYRGEDAEIYFKNWLRMETSEKIDYFLEN